MDCHCSFCGFYDLKMETVIQHLGRFLTRVCYLQFIFSCRWHRNDINLPNRPQWLMWNGYSLFCTIRHPSVVQFKKKTCFLKEQDAHAPKNYLKVLRLGQFDKSLEIKVKTDVLSPNPTDVLSFHSCMSCVSSFNLWFQFPSCCWLLPQPSQVLNFLLSPLKT